MSLNTMVQRLLLEVPGIVSGYGKTLINEALGIIYDSQLWSWQLKEDGWLTPGLLFPVGSGSSAGTISVTPFTNTIVGDTVASAAWQAYIVAGTKPAFNQLQIRSPFYSLYNIVSTDTISNPPFTTLTLDRNWMEPTLALAPYMIYQAYFPAPVADFKRFTAARDTTNNQRMDYWTKSQKDLALEDPERTIFDDPAFIVPYQTDQRAGSATLGNMLYELWPQPLARLPYTFSYLRRGPLLANAADAPPYPLTEECVLWRAKEVAFVFKEAQKGEDMQRGSGANWQYLAEAAHDEYKLTLKAIKDTDRDLCDLYFSRYVPDNAATGEPFATVTGQLNVGRM